MVTAACCVHANRDALFSHDLTAALLLYHGFGSSLSMRDIGRGGHGSLCGSKHILTHIIGVGVMVAACDRLRAFWCVGQCYRRKGSSCASLGVRLATPIQEEGHSPLRQRVRGLSAAVPIKCRVPQCEW
jgi:hypothetical protein